MVGPDRELPPEEVVTERASEHDYSQEFFASSAVLALRRLQHCTAVADCTFDAIVDLVQLAT